MLWGVLVRFQVLGPVRAWRGSTEVDLGPAGPRAVLGLLVLADGQPLSRAELVDALWGNRPPPTAVNVIQTYIKRLRQLLEPDRRPHGPSLVIPSVGDGYRLPLPAGAADLTRFRQLLSLAVDVHRDGEQRALPLLGEALKLWQGPPLAGVACLAGHPSVVALDGERRAVVRRYAAAMIAAGAAAEALPALEHAAALDPLDEAAQALLIRGYQAAGQRARAFALYENARRQLVAELGVDPGPELLAAHAALLRGSRPDGRQVAPGAEGLPIPGVLVGDTGRALTGCRPAADPRRPVPAQLPADVHGFTGRAAELRGLDQLLRDFAPPDGPGRRPTAMGISVVSGVGGVGKTALAVHWAHQVRAAFGDGQLYVDLRGSGPGRPLGSGEALTRFLTALGVAGSEIPRDDEDRAARYRTQVSGRRMLILLDDAATVEQVRPLLPGTPSCLVVVTSRDTLSGFVALHGARRLIVDPLPLPDAVVLLRTLVGARVDAEPAAAASLAVHCAMLPLALRVAAERAATRSTTPLREIVAELADWQRRLDPLHGALRATARGAASWPSAHLPYGAAAAFPVFGVPPGPDDRPAAGPPVASPPPASASWTILSPPEHRPPSRSAYQRRVPGP